MREYWIVQYRMNVHRPWTLQFCECEHEAVERSRELKQQGYIVERFSL